MSQAAKFERNLKVLVVHQSPVLRMGLSGLLNKQPHLSTEETDPAGDLLGRLKASEPDVVIYGDGGGRSGADAVMATLKASGRAPRLVLMKDHWTPPEIMSRIASGASGFVTPHDPLTTIMSAIEQAASSYGVVIGQSAPSVPAKTDGALDADRSEPEGFSVPLTTREVEILRCAAKGVTVGETAKLLHISLSTVKNHRHNIFAKLGVANAAAAVALAQTRGII